MYLLSEELQQLIAKEYSDLQYKWRDAYHNDTP
jgi:hypothetical protein